MLLLMSSVTSMRLMASGNSNRFVEAVLIRIRDERMALGYSQERLAELSGIDLGVISRAERLLRVPAMAAIRDLARALGLDFAGVVREAEASLAE